MWGWESERMAYRGKKGGSQTKAQSGKPDTGVAGVRPGNALKAGSSRLTLHPWARVPCLCPGGPPRRYPEGSVICFRRQQCLPASNGVAQPVPARGPLVLPRAVRAGGGGDQRTSVASQPLSPRPQEPQLPTFNLD